MYSFIWKKIQICFCFCCCILFCVTKQKYYQPTKKFMATVLLLQVILFFWKRLSLCHRLLLDVACRALPCPAVLCHSCCYFILPKSWCCCCCTFLVVYIIYIYIYIEMLHATKANPNEAMDCWRFSCCCYYYSFYCFYCWMVDHWKTDCQSCSGLSLWPTWKSAGISKWLYNYWKTTTIMQKKRRKTSRTDNIETLYGMVMAGERQAKCTQAIE